MSNPRTLQELADSLAESANTIRAKMQESVHYVPPGSYMDALLDTRATVLAMIAEGREVIRTVHEYPPAVKVGSSNVTGTSLHKAEPDPDRDEETSTDYPYTCVHCHKDIKRVPGGNGPTWVHEATGMVVG